MELGWFGFSLQSHLPSQDGFTSLFTLIVTAQALLPPLDIKENGFQAGRKVLA